MPACVRTCERGSIFFLLLHNRLFAFCCRVVVVSPSVNHTPIDGIGVHARAFLIGTRFTVLWIRINMRVCAIKSETWPKINLVGRPSSPSRQPQSHSLFAAHSLHRILHAQSKPFFAFCFTVIRVRACMPPPPSTDRPTTWKRVQFMKIQAQLIYVIKSMRAMSAMTMSMMLMNIIIIYSNLSNGLRRRWRRRLRCLLACMRLFVCDAVMLQTHSHASEPLFGILMHKSWFI